MCLLGARYIYIYATCEVYEHKATAAGLRRGKKRTSETIHRSFSPMFQLWAKGKRQQSNQHIGNIRVTHWERVSTPDLPGKTCIFYAAQHALNLNRTPTPDHRTALVQGWLVCNAKRVAATACTHHLTLATAELEDFRLSPEHLHRRGACWS